MAEQRKYEETVSTLISQKTELQMTQAEYEWQVHTEKEKALLEVQHMAWAEAEAKQVRDAPSRAVKRIVETMESFAKRSRMDGDEEHSRPPRPPIWDFNHEGKLLQPVSYHGNNVEGMRHALTMRPDFRDKIIKAEFTPLEKLSSDDLLQQALRQAEMSELGYVSHNVPLRCQKHQ